MRVRDVCGQTRGMWRQSILVMGTFCAVLLLPSCASWQQYSVKSIAVLESDESPAFRRVTQEVTRQAGVPVETFRLSGGGMTQHEILRRLQTGSQDIVIAVGLPAARASLSLAGKRVVYCQVFNYEASGLITSAMKGVSALPPVREQFRTWKAINPNLRRVGVITGPQQRILLAEARLAARENGLELSAVEVNSDRETLYAFKRLAPGIQGLWLVPDNRVLSAAILEDLMAHAVKQGKQVLAFSHEMLALGALLSVESSSVDIASQVLARSRESSGSAAGVLPLTRGDIRVNGMMLRRFGLVIPRGFEGLVHAS